MSLGFLLSKPVLIGIHLGIAIIGIDAFIWYIGELIADKGAVKRIRIVAIIGVVAFSISWFTGGYYYVLYYGSLVKPLIVEGSAPWAHKIIMEIKEHIFLFIVPLAGTAMFLAHIDKDDFKNKFRKIAFALALTIVILGLSIGAMGYIVSAAARWGAPL